MSGRERIQVSRLFKAKLSKLSNLHLEVWCQSWGCFLAVGSRNPLLTQAGDLRKEANKPEIRSSWDGGSEWFTSSLGPAPPGMKALSGSPLATSQRMWALS